MEEYIDADYRDTENTFFLDKDITAYVEGLDDVVFWEDVFRKFAPSLKIIFYPHSRESEYKSGKQKVLTKDNIKNANSKLILCVDSDFDYLLKNEPVYSHPYIFHTYAYSIENFKVFSYNLNIIAKKCSLPLQETFCFIKFFEAYSKTIYEIFLYMFFFRKQEYNAKNQGLEVKSEILISNKNLNSVFGFDQSEIDLSNNGESLIKLLKDRVNECKLEIENKYENIDLKAIENDLIEEFEVKPENIYWYIRGHILYDCVVTHLLKKIVKIYQEERKNDYNIDSQEGKNKLNEYKNHTKGIHWETLLKDGHNSCLLYLELCPLMEKIKQDIDRYLQEFNLIKNKN
ncbi:ABC transporter ATP-binding protein [Planktothrix serta PCC 8927]|uniref:ABC transporter ATP-binding protein n=1 Tax=Planktothrix serta PCC 8927 TaxID=671068 RepID=A0A7Z9BK30_9CYAN|nr:DUF4435 domain-containing protein [Planktothrix serta]VXD15722.1 ABC transporter ATP-binding protein [Planktothrix serta PCC 8927]